MVNEWIPDGLKEPESSVVAKRLEQEGMAYISAVGGTYESFFLPEIVKKAKKPVTWYPWPLSSKRTWAYPSLQRDAFRRPRKRNQF